MTLRNRIRLQLREWLGIQGAQTYFQEELDNLYRAIEPLRPPLRPGDLDYIPPKHIREMTEEIEALRKHLNLRKEYYQEPDPNFFPPQPRMIERIRLTPILPSKKPSRRTPKKPTKK
jgi:hypothetical protein